MMFKVPLGNGTSPRTMNAKQAANYAEFRARCIEQQEQEIANDRPELWPLTSELPESDVSDLMQLAQYQSTIDAEFESQ